MNSGSIGRPRHCSTERVDLFDQVPFADAAYRRIATHLTQRLDALRDEQSSYACTRSRKSGLGACVAAADYNDIEVFSEPHVSTLSGSRALYRSLVFRYYRRRRPGNMMTASGRFPRRREGAETPAA